MNTPNRNQPGQGAGAGPNGPGQAGQGPQVDPQMGPQQGQHFYGPQWGMPPVEGMPPPGYGYPGFMPPPPYPYGYYGAPGLQMPPPGPMPGAFPGAAPVPTPEQAQVEAMFNDMADKSGLGMLKGFFNTGDGDFWKGALVGAAVVMLLTNESLRDSLVGGAAKAAEAVKSGFGMGGEEETDDSDDNTASNDTREENEA